LKVSKYVYKGIGLSATARETLFQPFQQAQRMAGGTGLGLFSLSKRVEALGGFRGVEERKDGKRGSNFWFSFPYRPDRTEEGSDLAGGRIGSLMSRESLYVKRYKLMHPP
jgi:signal transduction histidine kinase